MSDDRDRAVVGQAVELHGHLPSSRGDRRSRFDGPGVANEPRSPCDRTPDIQRRAQARDGDHGQRRFPETCHRDDLGDLARREGGKDCCCGLLRAYGRTHCQASGPRDRVGQRAPHRRAGNDLPAALARQPARELVPIDPACRLPPGREMTNQEDPATHRHVASDPRRPKLPASRRGRPEFLRRAPAWVTRRELPLGLRRHRSHPSLGPMPTVMMSMSHAAQSKARRAATRNPTTMTHLQTVRSGTGLTYPRPQRLGGYLHRGGSGRRKWWLTTSKPRRS